MFNEKFIKASNSFDFDYKGDVSAPLFRRRFKLNKFKQATLYVCGLGYAYYYLNEKNITEDLFTAPVSNYDKLCWVNKYDVTDKLEVGDNILAVICGCGFLNENFDSHWGNNKTQWRDNPKFAIRLVVDGEIVLRSDESFVCKERSFVTHNQLRSGEVFDARLYDAEWKSLNYKDFDWKNAVVDNKLNPEFKLCECEPIREVEYYDFIDCKQVETGYVLDFGVNFSGYILCSINEENGKKIVFKHAEEIYPDGTLKLNGLDILYPRVPFQTDVYICGEKPYKWSPKFTYHGFRYVLVEGLSNPPKIGEIKGVFVHQTVERKTEFDCSEKLFNQIYDAGIRATYSNLHYALTDCPTREKFGWTNDAQASAEQIVVNFDSEKFFAKWIEDFKYNMLDDGQLPAIVPSHGYGYTMGPVADGAFFEIPFRIFQYTGNSSLLIKCLPYFKRYYQYFTSKDCEEIDWLCDWDGYTNHDIGKDFIRLVYTEKLCRIILLAQELAKEEICEAYKIDRKNALLALNDYIKNGYSTIESQTGIAVLLCLGVGDKEKLISQLKLAIDKDGGKINCGMFGIQYIYDALSDNGAIDYVYKIVTASEAPSFKVWFDNGATTLWETWKDSGFTDSRNHQMYSNILAWFIKYPLGIKIDYTKNEDIYIKPSFMKQLSYCQGKVNIFEGQLAVRWERKEKTVEITVELSNISNHCYFCENKLQNGINKFTVSLDI